MEETGPHFHATCIMQSHQLQQPKHRHLPPATCTTSQFCDRSRSMMSVVHVQRAFFENITTSEKKQKSCRQRKQGPASPQESSKEQLTPFAQANG
jgi:hypothetical protein